MPTVLQNTKTLINYSNLQTHKITQIYKTQRHAHSFTEHKDIHQLLSQFFHILITNTKTLHTFIQIKRPNKANPNENQIAKTQSYTVDRRERESEMSLGLALLLWWLSWRCS